MKLDNVTAAIGRLKTSQMYGEEMASSALLCVEDAEKLLQKAKDELKSKILERKMGKPK